MLDYKSLTRRARDAIILAVLSIGLGCAVAAACMVLPTDSVGVTAEVEGQLQGLKVVIDAGHGGKDGGAQGYKTSVKEADINIDIALKLREALLSVGAEVVMTRQNGDAVADSKQEDMRTRREIIENAGQDITISIHQNSFPDHSVSGPQVMYASGSEEGEALATCIQNCLVEMLNPPKLRVVLSGEYYILNSGTAPAILVECGFLSNEEEEALLIQEEYRVKIVHAIMQGICDYVTHSD